MRLLIPFCLLAISFLCISEAMLFRTHQDHPEYYSRSQGDDYDRELLRELYKKRLIGYRPSTNGSQNEKSRALMNHNKSIKMNAEMYGRSVHDYRSSTSDEHENSDSQNHDEKVGRNHDSSRDLEEFGFHPQSRSGFWLEARQGNGRSRIRLPHRPDSRPQPEGRTLHITKCPNVRGISNITDSDGLWYEIERFPNLVENRMRCVKAQYSFSETEQGQQFEVKVEGIRGELVASYEGISVKSEEPDQSDFRLTMDIHEELTVDIPYKILVLEPGSHALVYSCDDSGRFARKNVWIMSRSKTLHKDIIDNLHAILIQRGIRARRLQTVDQSC